MSNHIRTLLFSMMMIAAPAFLPATSMGDDLAKDAVTDTAREEVETPAIPTKDLSALKCPHYKVYYIDPSAQFFTPPVPLEDHAEFVFCSAHEDLDAIRTKLAKMKPIGSHADAGAARIKVVPKGKPGDALIFCATGEITYRGKQYRLDRRFYEPSLLSLREEGDRQRAMAIEKEDDNDDSRNPASEKSADTSAEKSKNAAKSVKKSSKAISKSGGASAPSTAGALPTPTATPPGI